MTRRTAAPIPAPDPTVLRVREPGDILGVVPYLLGFHPTESLVAAFVRQRQVVVTARIDLAATADVEALVDQLELVGRQIGSRSLVLIGYSADGGVRDLMRDLADLVPLDLVDVLAVSGDRWWSVCCDGECCPPEGRPYDIASHPLAAAAVMAGISATATRQEIADLAAGPPTADHGRLGGLAEDTVRQLAGMSPRRRRQRMKRLIDRTLRSGGPTEAEAIEIAVLARDLAVRDAAWALMSRAEAADHVVLWRRVVSVAVWPSEAAPLGMLAMAGWLSGNGALLNCCIERLERVAPDYSLLRLCRDISDQAVPPRHFDVIAEEMRATLG
ncbi:MAG TPA: DUF4192 domain-containing protein [Microlunatus sp.]